MAKIKGMTPSVGPGKIESRHQTKSEEHNEHKPVMFF